MAFDVTPTSGASPYTLTIDLFNKAFIDGIHYRMESRLSSSVGSCPVPSSSPSQAMTQALLTQGTYIRTVPIADGSCGVFKVDIIDVATNTVVSTQSVSVDNI